MGGYAFDGGGCIQVRTRNRPATGHGTPHCGNYLRPRKRGCGGTEAVGQGRAVPRKDNVMSKKVVKRTVNLANLPPLTKKET